MVTVDSNETCSLSDKCRGKLLDSEDIYMLRVYLTLLGKEIKESDMDFQNQVVELLQEGNLKASLNPEV